MNNLPTLILSNRVAPAENEIFIRCCTGSTLSSDTNQLITYRLTTPTLTTGTLIDLLIYLDQLGFHHEETHSC